MALNVGQLFARLTLNTQNFQSGLNQVESALRGLGKKILSLGLGAIVTKQLKQAIDSAVDFQARMEEVFTLLPDITSEAMDEMSNQAKQFSRDFGVLPEETVPALYQAISASVPADNVFSFLETAQMLAKAGIADLTTTVDGLSSVVNAYGSDILDARTASDLMFTTIKNGKTTADELARSLYNVVPTAASVGVKFEHISAALATMTKQGVPTSVATTQLRQLLVELSKEGTKTNKIFTEIANVGFRDFIAQGGTMQEALLMLEEYANKTGVGVNDLFSSVEAGNAVLQLTGKNAGTFAADLEAMAGAAGATEEAFSKVGDTAQHKIDKAKASFEVLRIEIGEKLLPIVVYFMEILAKLLDWFLNLPDGVQNTILAFTGLLAAIAVLTPWIINIINFVKLVIPLFAKLGVIVTWAGKIFALLKGAAVALGGVLAGISAPVWIVIGVIAALIAIGVLLWKNWDAVKQFLINTWNRIKEIAINVWNGIIEFFTVTVPEALQALITWFSELPGKIWEFLKQLPVKVAEALGFMIGTAIRLGIEFTIAVVNFFKELPGKVWTWLVDLWEKVKTGFNNLKDSAITAVTNLYNNTLQFFRELPGKVREKVQEMANKVKEKFEQAKEWAKTAARNLLNGVRDIITNLPGIFTNIWNNIINFLSGLPGKLWDKAKEIASGFWKGFKKGLGIASPSYVEHAFFDMVTAAKESLHDLRRLTPQIERAASMTPALANLGVNDINPAMARQENRRLAQRKDLGRTNENGGGNGQTIIENHFYVDGKEVTTTISKRQERMLSQKNRSKGRI